MNGYGEYDESYDESWDESYDESDIEAAFEDLEYDEARRRRRRRRRPRRRGGRVPVPAVAPRPGPSANLQRDRQLAKAVNVVGEDVFDMEARLAKVNGDLARLKQVSLVSLLLPRGQNLTLKRLSVADGGGLTAVDPPANTAPAAGQVDVVTNVGSKLDIIPLVLFMSMTRGIGQPGRGPAAAGADNMMPLLMIVLLQQQQQQQQQAGGQAAQQAAGGLDSTALLVLMMAMGGMS